MIKYTINKKEVTPFPHYWEMCVGSANAYTALRADYREQLKKAHDELGFQYVRFHGLFDDHMSTLLMKKDHMGNEFGLVYNFMNIDNIFDYLLEIGMKPFIELGYMPSAIASGDKTVFHYKGNITLPKDNGQWEELIRRFVTHIIERYGLEEVKTWFFEVWNEPNLFFFFDGDKNDYFKLYEVTARTIKSVDKNLKVGGPATSCNSWIKDFIEFCEGNDVPLDFISTHHYPTDDPLWSSGLDILDFYKSELSGKRDYERGVMKKMTQFVRDEAGSYPVYFTEWNTSAMTNDHKHDEPFASAMIAKILADNDGLVEGYSYWTFSDIFEESGQLAGAFHGGFGLQTYHGIPKPAYRLFELFHGLGTQRIAVGGMQEEGTVEMLATKTEDGYRLLLHNHNIPDNPIQEEMVRIELGSITSAREGIIYRIDEDHSNPKALWLDMGAPEYPSKEQVRMLCQASELSADTIALNEDGCIEISVPPYGVVAIDIKE